jgi:hypothetical protein
VRDARLNLVSTVLAQFAVEHRHRRQTMTTLERAIYERALVLGIKELYPRDEGNAILARHEEEVRARAAATEAARNARKTATPPAPPTQGQGKGEA